MSAERAKVMIEDLSVTARFLTALPRYLRRPFSPAEARAIVSTRFSRREKYFLGALYERVFARKDSPYLKLIREAGITEGDLTGWVNREGVEGCLQQLLHAGVYLTVDEFKGRKPVRRGPLEFRIQNAELVSPSATVHGVAKSSGSGGSPTAVPIDLASIYGHAVNTLVTLDGHGGASWSHAHWGRPGGTSVSNQVEFALSGNPPRKWFNPVPIAGTGIHPRYRWGHRAMHWSGRLAGVSFPPPTICTLEDPEPLLEWAQAEVAQGRTPHVWTFASSAVRACAAALSRGTDLEGVWFTAGGEPTTEARRNTIERTGARVLPRYGTTETDIISFACAHPAAPDDQHFLHDRLALIQVGESRPIPGVPPGGLLISSLLPSAPITLINVSLGDWAQVSERDCGCPLQAIGWKTHLDGIFSFEKLTAGGTTFLDSDLVELLEVELPARFGGVATDYQLVEAESPLGETEVRLLAHPSLGALDERHLCEFFHSKLGRKGGGDKLMEEFWRISGFLRVERRIPHKTGSGKIPHVFRLNSR